MLTPRGRDERGAAAVLYAILITAVLIPVAALSTDLGNAMSRKTATQTQADFAALDAAQQLNGSVGASSAGDPVPAAIVDAVAASMNANQPQHDGHACWRDTTTDCVASTQLTDLDLNNGEVRFTSDGLQVISPQAHVQFGLANAFGASGTDVSSAATVNVFSPGPGVVPMFAVDGCDYGLQTLADPANGHVTPIPPTLAYDSDTDGNQMNLLSAVVKDSTGTTVESLVPNSTGNVLQLTSAKWRNVTRIGFFRGDNPDPALVESQSTLRSTAGSPLVTPYTLNSGGTIELDIPANVSATETVWYVRAFDNGAGKWSDRAEAVPIRVGQAVLQCGAGSNGGNFGTLRLPRQDVNASAEDIPRNIALGLEKPLNLVVHPEAVADPSLTTCSDNTNGAVESVWAHDQLDPNTNCTQTDPGFPSGVATAGLVSGGSGYDGLLTNEPTQSGCGPGGSSSMRTLNLNGTNYNINDDTLTCFLTNGKSIQDIVQDDAHYTAGVALDEAIFKSPRLLFVPVLRSEPANGSASYSIIDFRAAFITDEPATLAAIKNSNLATSENGLRTGTSQGQDKIVQIKVVFFNFKALPVDGDIPLQDYLGVGQPISRLID